MKLNLPHPLAVRPQTMARLRAMLELRLGQRGWTEAEVRQMAITLMRSFIVLLSMPEATANGRLTSKDNNDKLYESTTSTGNVLAQKQ